MNVFRKLAFTLLIGASLVQACQATVTLAPQKQTGLNEILYKNKITPVR